MDALLLVARSGRAGERYVLGGYSEWNSYTLAGIICTHLNQFLPGGAPNQRLIILVANHPGHDCRYAADLNKIARQLG
jgi:dTDP-glucose 4,6-dehydratase